LMAAVKKQVEYYLCDANICHDQFFHKKISENPDGWLNLELVVQCKKIQALGVQKVSTIVEALVGSHLETKTDDSASYVRRTTPLPTLVDRAQAKMEKKKATAHDGGVMMKIANVPEGMVWTTIRDALKEKVADKYAGSAKNPVLFVSSVNDDRECFFCMDVFEGDVAYYQELELTAEEKKLETSVCYGNDLAKGLAKLPRHVVKKREQKAKDRRCARQKPILINEQKFQSVGALRGKLKEMLNNRKDEEVIPESSPDYALVKAVLAFHPRFEEKVKGMTGLKVGKGEGQSKCFWIVSGEASDDFSVKKCLEGIEANPPYAP